MTTPDRDSVDAVARDLARFVRQQQEEGQEWYLDEGEPATPAVEAVAASEPAQVAEPAPEPTPEPAPAPDPAPAATPAPAAATTSEPASTDDDDKARREAAFQAVCDRFVATTLEQISKYRQAPDAPTESDMFAPGEDAPAPLDREGKIAALNELNDQVAGCEACKLHPTRTNTVFGVGDPDADLVFIGEAPGRNEDEQGEPFVGRAGKLLTDILKAIGFAREDVFICNILKCRPPENRDPEPDEVQACEPFLKRQLEILQPKVICCLGRHAAMTLLQTKASLRSMRESVHFYEGVPVLATFHPAALLRNPNWKRDTWDDVRKLRALHDALKGVD